MTDEEKTEETVTPISAEMGGAASVNPDDGFKAKNPTEAQREGLPTDEGEQRVLAGRMAGTGVFRRLAALFGSVFDLGSLGELLTGIDLTRLPELIRKISAVREANSLIDGIVFALEAFRVWADMTVSEKDDHLIEMIDKIIGKPETLAAFENTVRGSIKTLAGRNKSPADSEYHPLDLGNGLAGPDSNEFNAAGIGFFELLPLIKVVAEMLFAWMKQDVKDAVIKQ